MLLCYMHFKMALIMYDYERITVLEVIKLNRIYTLETVSVCVCVRERERYLRGYKRIVSHLPHWRKKH